MLRTREQGAAALALALLLGGCNPFDGRNWGIPESGSGGLFHAAWGGRPSDTMLADAPANNETVRRIRGLDTPEARLQVEPGNVWPAEEAPRATLANPDAALRGVPPWRPGEGRSARDLPIDERPGGPLVPPRADAAPGPAVEEQGPRAQRRRRDSSTPQPIVQPEPSRFEPPPVPSAGNEIPLRRDDGRVVLTPNGPVITGGGTGRVQSFTTPGGGGGVIHRDGGFTTVIPSGGQPQTFPTPR